MILVQDYLKHNTFQNLIDAHGVYAGISKCARKISLNYSQIESSNSDKLAQQCRGLILARIDDRPFLIKDGRIDLDQIAGDTKVIAYPFNRFFNYGMEDVDIDWSDNNIKVVEKLDGTLTIVYYDPFQDNWHVATRSVSEGDVDQNGFTFRSLFETAVKETLNKSFYEFVDSLDTTTTYMFELTSFYNRVVVKHESSSITLIGARDVVTLKEYDIHSIDLGIPVVKQHDLSDIHEILSHVGDLNPLESEGVIAVDSNFRRVKVKSAAYVALHHTISSVGSSDRNLLSLIMSGNDDDVLAELPEELADKLVKTKECFVKLSKKIDENYHQFCELSEKSDEINKRKVFALTLKRYNIRWQAPYFQIYNGKANNFLDLVEKRKINNDWSNAFKDSILEELKEAGLIL